MTASSLVRRHVTGLLLAALGLVACSSGFTPESANMVLDELEGAGLVSCAERREPVPDVVTCESPTGDLTVGLTDDPAGAIRSTRVTAGGPWIVGDDWIVIAYGEDLDVVRQMRDVIGHGALYQDVDEVPVEVE